MKASVGELHSFVSTLESAIDNVSDARDNTGSLWQPYNRENWRTASFNISAQDGFSLPVPYDEHFKPGDDVCINARHLFDTNTQDFVFWMQNRTNPDQEKTSHEGTVSAHAWLHGEYGDERYYVSGGPTRYIERWEFTDIAGNLLHSKLPNIRQQLGKSGLEDTLTLAILNLQDDPDITEKTYRNAGVKSFRTNAAIGGFNLEAYTYSRFGPGDETLHIAAIALRRSFRAESYGGIYRGLIRQEVQIKRDGNNAITDASHEGGVLFFDEPAATRINDKDDFVVLGTEQEKQNLPEHLASYLPRSRDISTEDIAWYTHLITEPVEESDTEVCSVFE